MCQVLSAAEAVMKNMGGVGLYPEHVMREAEDLCSVINPSFFRQFLEIDVWFIFNLSVASDKNPLGKDQLFSMLCLKGQSLVLSPWKY